MCQAEKKIKTQREAEMGKGQERDKCVEKTGDGSITADISSRWTRWPGLLLVVLASPEPLIARGENPSQVLYLSFFLSFSLIFFSLQDPEPDGEEGR